jgi:hypothetical protein
MSEHRYPLDVLLGDYARAGAGIVLTGAPLVLLPLNFYVTSILGTLTALFAAFAGATYLRQRCRIELDAGAIAARGGVSPVRLSWDSIDSVRLRYFATRRDGKHGWMELTLHGTGGKLRLDSRVEDFSAIARLAGAAARRRHIGMTPSTTANFAALGIELGSLAAGE